MTVTSAPGITSIGTIQTTGKATGAAAAGVEAFAGVMADLQAAPGPVPDVASLMAAEAPAGAQADATVDSEGPQRITRRKRAVKEESLEVPIVATPAGAAPAQIAIAQPVAFAADAPAAGSVVTDGKSPPAAPVGGRTPEITQANPEQCAEQAEQSETATVTPLSQATPVKDAPTKTQFEIVAPAGFAQTDGSASPDGRNAPQDGQTRSGHAAAESRKGVVSAPVSLTAIADIVQSLPPIAQSQMGAVPADAVAVRAATDVGATLAGEVIDMGVGGQWIDRVAREITALAQGSGHSRFQLSPPNLGRLQIDVWQGEGGGRVQLLTETDEAAQRLRQDQASLQADVRLSALSLDRIVIDRAPGAFGASQEQGRSPNGDTADRSGSQNSGQTGNQTAAQNGGNGGSAKVPFRRDVFNDRTQADAPDGRPSGRSDDRHVRYA